MSGLSATALMAGDGRVQRWAGLRPPKMALASSKCSEEDDSAPCRACKLLPAGQQSRRPPGRHARGALCMARRQGPRHAEHAAWQAVRAAGATKPGASIGQPWDTQVGTSGPRRRMRSRASGGLAGMGGGWRGGGAGEAEGRGAGSGERPVEWRSAAPPRRRGPFSRLLPAWLPRASPSHHALPPGPQRVWMRPGVPHSRRLMVEGSVCFPRIVPWPALCVCVRTCVLPYCSSCLWYI